ncbi:GntR family transcriptional regulator [Streptomyces virginiae]|uniref:winged helix-turn-helix domain-containing protein n=1 Tax=Streptomyces virginiae TaxID=1961 RepID=UPI00365A2223
MTAKRHEVQMVEWTGKPAYQQVAEQLRRRIAAGEFAESRKLPSLADLQATYGVTVTVARDAIRQLKTDGLAVSHQGKGAFLTAEASEAAKLAGPEAAIAELREQVARLQGEVTDLRERVAELEEK